MNIGELIDHYQEWVDYDMKRYGKISDETNRDIEEAGLQIVKDKYGDYEVIAGKYNEKFNKHSKVFNSTLQGFKEFGEITDNKKLLKQIDEIKTVETIDEDVVKKANGKWTNRGDDGKEHGEFDTKAEAEAQMRAMYARGYKGESATSKQKLKIDEDEEVVKVSSPMSVEEFVEWHDNADNYREYPDKFDKIYNIFDENGSNIGEDVGVSYSNLSYDDQLKVTNIINGSQINEDYLNETFTEDDFNNFADEMEDDVRRIASLISHMMQNHDEYYELFEHLIDELVNILRNVSNKSQTESLKLKESTDSLDDYKVYEILIDTLVPNSINLARTLSPNSEFQSEIVNVLRKNGLNLAHEIINYKESPELTKQLHDMGIVHGNDTIDDLTDKVLKKLDDNGYDTSDKNVRNYAEAAAELIINDVNQDIDAWYSETLINYPEDLEELPKK